MFDFALQAEIIGVFMARRQVAQGGGEAFDHLLRIDDDAFRRCGEHGVHHRVFIGAVQNGDTSVVHDNDFTDEAVGFFHQHDVEFLTIRDIDTHLGTADTDGGHRRVQRHGVRIGFGDLTGHEGEHTLHHGHGHGTFLSAGVVNHFVQNHAAFFGHGERGFVGQDHTDGAVGIGFENVALEHRIARVQFNAGTIHADHGDRAFNAVDRTDGLFLDSFAAGLGYHSRRVGVGQVIGQIGRHFRTLIGLQRGLRLNGVEILDHNLGAVGPRQDQVGTIVVIVRRRRVQTFGQDQRIAAGCIEDEALTFGCAGRKDAVVLIIGSHDIKPSENVS